jgi:hypothetical protein
MQFATRQLRELSPLAVLIDLGVLSAAGGAMLYGMHRAATRVRTA